MIHRPVKSKRKSALLNSNRIGNHSVAWRATNSLSHPVGQANGQHLRPARSEREQRPGKAREGVAQHHEALSLATAIAEVTGKEFEQAGDRFGSAFNHAHNAWTRAQGQREEDRK